ncbi:hypothetical protein Tco_0155841 [Tanacetum coccineum]
MSYKPGGGAGVADWTSTTFAKQGEFKITCCLNTFNAPKPLVGVQHATNFSSTSNPIDQLQAGLDDQPSQSEHEYISLDEDTGETNDTNEDPSERDNGNHNGEDEVLLKHKRQRTSKV